MTPEYPPKQPAPTDETESPVDFALTRLGELDEAQPEASLPVYAEIADTLAAALDNGDAQPALRGNQ